MNNFELLRAKSGLSAEELAEKAGVALRTIYRLQAGEKAHTRTLIKLAAALEIDLELLADLKEIGRGKRKRKEKEKETKDNANQN